MKNMIVFALMFVVVAATMDERFFPDSSEDTAVKRGVAKKDILSSVSCRYLKTNGYLARDAKWRQLCLKTYHCNDLFSKKSCNVAKARNECAKNSKLSLTYCRFTCYKCGVQPCSKSVPLGMQSKAIPDSKITASSTLSQKYYPPSAARLHMKPANGHLGYWVSKYNRVGHWLQVDLSKISTITAVATQGRPQGGEWTKSYSLQYSLNGSTFKNYQAGKVFAGNTDKNTVVKNALNPPIRARYVRVLPKTWHSYMVLRMELYGCK